MSKISTKILLIAVLMLGLVFVSFDTFNEQVLRGGHKHTSWVNAEGEEVPLVDTFPDGLKKILVAYPKSFKQATFNSVIWPDGSEMMYDDGNMFKSYYDMLKTPDLEDMMKLEYVDGAKYETPPAKNDNPGVIRYEPFFYKMYGNSKDEVRARLKNIIWLPTEDSVKMKITTVNGLNEKMQAISDELTKKTHLMKYLTNPGGSFNWRLILNTNSISMHSFGIAVDINVANSNYWRWDSPGVNPEDGKDIPYKNHIPYEIAEVFERYGFIWGAKWYHYDTMHFEYRPELFVEL